MAIERAAQDDTAALTGTGYLIYAVMPSSGNALSVGLLHPDGLVELCEDSRNLRALDVAFPAETELGELPEGMNYAYKQSIRPPRGIAFTVAGVRLSDGTVVKNLTLLNGRIVPATPGSDS